MAEKPASPSCFFFAASLVLLTLSSCLASPTPTPPSPSCLSGTLSNILYRNNNASFPTVLENYIRNARWNTTTTPKPSLIITPLQEADVQAAVLCAKRIGLQIRIRSGGHDYEGLSYVSRSQQPYFVLDMSNLRQITVDIGKQVATNATDLAVQWQQVAPTIDDRFFLRLLLLPSNKTVKASIVAFFLGGADEAVSILKKKFPLLGLEKQNCIEMSWIESAIWLNNPDDYKIGVKPEIILNRRLNTAGFLKRKSDYVQVPISKEALEGIAKKIIELGKVALVFNPYGGKMAEIPADATAFPHRAGNLFKIQYSVNWNDSSPAAAENFVNETRSLYSYMTPFVSKNPRSAFLNYRDLDIGINTFGKNSYEEGKVYGAKYFNGNFERLVKIKTAVDPDNFFRNEQSIPILPNNH
ncbi:hypothetical protein Ahy_Scaffold6g107891 [Arachis hypogaea]|uniref:FAD-binding PCMH-type domain-containing protein n=1 Tax=Arachis hypogaea TaxID=3818 RepID=A0A444WNU7_ARAHY|nr:hypothetical protein Ahy_Scaffold6g107891 [Arachis hypogaea]